MEEPATAMPREEAQENNSSAPFRRRTDLSWIHETIAQRQLSGLEDDDEDSEDDDSERARGHENWARPDARSSGLIGKLTHLTSYKEQFEKENMDRIREKLDDTYLREGENILLHGYLHIQIIRASNLRNGDRFNPFMCKWSLTDKSDPYVTVYAGVHRLVKTPVIMDTLNPEWNQDFYVPVCHFVKELVFRVYDWDNIGGELLGTTTLSVHELITFADAQIGASADVSLHDNSCSSSQYQIARATRARQFRRCGVHKQVHLDHKPHHGSLEYFVDFIPKDLLHTQPRLRGLLTKKSPVTMVVPGVYFPLRQQNRVRLYINADDGGEGIGTPKVTYGQGNSKTWKPRRYFRDVYDSISRAKHMVYIVGWSVDYTISLLRGREQTEGLHATEMNTTYSPFVGELLNQKADEGVVVNMLVWDDNTSNAINRVGVVGTRDEQLRDYFKGSKVNLRLVPMVGGKVNMLKKFRNAVYYTHHQKCVICDTPQNELVAYVGGIDLTYGRYDDGSYPLFRTLKTDHKDDFHQACFAVNRAHGPRQPWHDIHSRVQGPGTLDLLKNFEERWVGQGGLEEDLVNLESKGVSTSPTGPLAEEMREEDDTWHTQLYRSIDEKTAKLTVEVFKPLTFDDTKGVEFDESKVIKGGKRKTLLQHLLQTGPEREHHFKGNGQEALETITVARPLDFKRDLQVDQSVHKALIHHIRNAQHTIYIESQYFLSSSFQWDAPRKTGICGNLVAAEITFKICEKIEAGERFTAYIVVPMWPEGLPDALSVQDILFYQSATMASMYTRIQASIDRRLRKLKDEEVEQFADITPTDYLNFYCLATREGVTNPNEATSGTALPNTTRRHLVYTHSKMTIVDDSVILCGSANINQRSMDGSRDSELLMGAWQPGHLASPKSVGTGDVHGFRLHCWAHLTGTMEEIYRQPSSLECVRRINEIAKYNWELYTQEEVVQMTSYLVPYPVKITQNGRLVPATKDGKFPDTKSSILGGQKPSLPRFLTT